MKTLVIQSSWNVNVPIWRCIETVCAAVCRRPFRTGPGSAIARPFRADLGVSPNTSMLFVFGGSARLIAVSERSQRSDNNHVIVEQLRNLFAEEIAPLRSHPGLLG